MKHLIYFILRSIFACAVIMFLVFPAQSLAIKGSDTNRVSYNTEFIESYNDVFSNAQSWVNSQKNNRDIYVPVTVRDLDETINAQGMVGAVFCPPSATTGYGICNKNDLDTENGLIVVNTAILDKIQSLPKTVREVIVGSIIAHEQTHAQQYQKNGLANVDYYENDGRVNMSEYVTSPEETEATLVSLEYVTAQTVGKGVSDFMNLTQKLSQEIKANRAE